MRVAITGDKGGLGQMFTGIFQRMGYEIVGFDKKDDCDLTDPLDYAEAVDIISECDWFVNIAHKELLQAKLLRDVFERWKGDENRRIIVISSFATEVVAREPLYASIKAGLDHLVYQLRLKNLRPHIMKIKPGVLNTDAAAHLDFPKLEIEDMRKVIEPILNLPREVEVMDLTVKSFRQKGVPLP